MQRTGQDMPRLRFRDAVGTLRHSWRPSSTLSVENFATLTDTVTNADALDLRSTTTSLSSFTVWRPAEHPLTVTGQARFNGVSTRSNGSGSSSYNTNASVSASYDLTRALRVSGTLSGSLNAAQETSVSTAQSASVSYSPDGFRLLDSDYTWFTSASTSNSTGEGASRGVSGVIGHGLSRAFPLGSDGVYSLSGNVNESLSASYNTLGGTIYTLGHGAFVALGRSTLNATSRARLTLQDARTFASGGDESNTDSSVQSATLQLTHDVRFSRFDSLAGTLVLSVTRQELDAGATTFPSSSIGLSYRNARVFGINQLRFLSTLSVSADSLSLLSAGEDGRRDIDWNNRLDYSIGRTEARLTAAVTDSNGRLNTVVFFTLSRRLDGVF
jgi:hypothetical protein